MNASASLSIDAQCHEWADDGRYYAEEADKRRDSFTNRTYGGGWYAAHCRTMADRIIALRTRQANTCALCDGDINDGRNCSALANMTHIFLGGAL